MMPNSYPTLLQLAWHPLLAAIYFGDVNYAATTSTGGLTVQRSRRVAVGSPNRFGDHAAGLERAAPSCSSRDTIPAGASVTITLVTTPGVFTPSVTRLK